MDKNAEFLRDLMRYSDKLKEYATNSTEIDSDIARGLAKKIYFSIKKDNINELYNVLDFVYGLLFDYEKFHQLFLIISDIMKLIRKNS